MSFHTVAWTATVATVSATDVPPVADQQILVQNNHFVFSNLATILYAAWMHAVAGQAQFVTPSLRQVTSPRLHNLIRAAQPATFPQLQDYRRNPLQIKPLEELQLLVTNAAATSGVGWGVAGINTGNAKQSQAGQPFTLRGIATTAAVAGAWTLINVTWSDSLPNGRYAVNGLSHASAGGIASRLIFKNQVDRPGALSQVSEFLIQNQMFLDGGLGEYGTFENYAMPQVEVLALSADTAHVVLLDITRLTG